MIRRISKIKNLGVFCDAKNIAGCHLGKVNLVYGLNGYGKTTLLQIFRSLQTGTGASLLEGKTLGVSDTDVECDLTIGNLEGPEVLVSHKAGTWKQMPNIIIFDSRFVSENVYSDFDVNRPQRERLTSLLLGEKATGLAKEIRRLEAETGVKTRSKNQLEERLKAYSKETNIDDFISLKSLSPEEELRRSELIELGKAQKQRNSILKLTIPKAPELNLGIHATLETLREALDKTLPGVPPETANLVQDHIAARLDEHGEDWLKIGAGYFARSNESCPFCNQSVDHASILIQAFCSYFSEAYIGHKQNLTATFDKSLAIFNGIQTKLSNIELASSKIRQVFDSSSQYFSEKLRNELNASVDTLEKSLLSRLEQIKEAFPTELIEIRETVRQKQLAPLLKQAISPLKIEVLERELLDLEVSQTKFIVQLSEALKDLQETLQNSEKETILAGELSSLTLRSERHSTQCVKLVEEYLADKLSLDENKKSIENHKDELKKSLTEATQLIQRVNRYLQNFGCRFVVEPGGLDDKGNMPVWELKYKLNGHQVEPQRFAKVFSESEKRAVAFAYFLALIEEEPEVLASSVVVLDDPFTSFDDNRISSTVNEIVRLGQKVEQMFVFCHYLHPLIKIAEGTDGHRFLQIEFSNSDGSILNLANLDSLSVTEHERRLLKLELLKDGILNRDTAPAGLRELRIAIEHELKFRYRGILRGTQCHCLGQIIDLLKEREVKFRDRKAEDVIAELYDINSVSRENHHSNPEVPDFTSSPEQARAYLRRGLELINSVL